MVCRRGRGWCSGRHSQRFTIYRLSHGRRQSSNSPRIASGTLAKCEHAMPSWINSSNSIQSTSIFSKSKHFRLLCQLDRIEFPSPHNENAFLVFHFSTSKNQLKSNPIKKVELHSFLPSLKRALKEIHQQANPESRALYECLTVG